MINWIKSWFKPVVPHICEYKCVGYCDHFNMSSDLDFAIKRPTSNHFPPPAIIKNWVKKGFSHAETFQSHWKCSCGKKHTYFFLANPYCQSEIGRHRSKGTITKGEYSAMINFNPIRLKSYRGKSINELTNELCEELGFIDVRCKDNIYSY